MDAYADSADAGEVVGCGAFDIAQARGDGASIGWRGDISEWVGGIADDAERGLTVLCSRSCVACIVGGEEQDSVVASGGEVDVGVSPGSVAVEGGVVED